MTRRKRTPSPAPPSQKRVAFEIPASLRQFSTISRSLASTMATTTGTGTGTGSYAHSYTNTFKPQASQSSTHSTSSFSTAPRPGQYAPSNSIPQKRSFSEFRPVTQSFQISTQSTTPARTAAQSSKLAEVVAIARAAVAAPISQSPESQHSSAASVSPANLANGPMPKSSDTPVLANDPNLIAHMVARQREENARARAAHDTPSQLPYTSEEPPLQPGEAPALTTHPNLIAQMVAIKRAENERLGNRERWARMQADYRASLSPGSQLINELNTQVGQNQVNQSQPRTISNPLPARSMPTIPPLKPPTPIIFNAQTPASQTPGAETMYTPTTEDSARPSGTVSQRRSSHDNDSLFGSPFSSPIVEFLEKATDNAGLKDALEPNELTSRKTSTSVASAQPPQSGHPAESAAYVSAETVHENRAQSEIPPLFSEKPPNSQPQPQHSSSIPTQNPYATPLPPSTNSVAQFQGPAPQLQAQSRGGPPQLAPRYPPIPKAIPHYPQHAGMPGYYRVELNQSWSNGGSSFVATPATSPTAYGQPPQPAGYSRFGGYPMSPVEPFVVGPGLPPAPGPLQTYGSTFAAATAADRTRHQPAHQTKHQSAHQAANGGYLTAADMVTGINTKFKIATTSGFSVPKRSTR